MSMSDYTPTTEEVRGDYAHFQVRTDAVYVVRDYASAEAEFDRWLAAHDAEVRAAADAEVWMFREQYIPRLEAAEAALAEQGETGEHVFIERYGMNHAKFGGIGGDVISLTLTRGAWKDLGEADVLVVSVGSVEEPVMGETEGAGA